MNFNAQLTTAARRQEEAEAIAIPASRRLLQRLFGIYVAGGAAGIAVTMLLALLGYEFSLHQWLAVAIFGTPGILIYTLIDIWLIARHYRPLEVLLAHFDRGELPACWDGVWTMTEK
jgi:hypothetical protein